MCIVCSLPLVYDLTKPFNFPRKRLQWYLHMSVKAFQICGNSAFCSTACSDRQQRTRQYYRPSVRGDHRWPVDSPHKGPVMQKQLPCLGVITMDYTWPQMWGSQKLVLHQYCFLSRKWAWSPTRWWALLSRCLCARRGYWYDTNLPWTTEKKEIDEHDDVIKWKHFPRYWPFVQGIHRSLVNSLHKGQWRWALMFSVICALNKRLSKQSWGRWF